MIMSHHLTDESWESLGLHVPFLCKLFNNQAQQLVQLKMANSILEDHAMEAQGNTMDAAAKAALSVVQAILSNMPTRGHSLRSTKAAEPESFVLKWLDRKYFSLRKGRL